MKTGLIHVYTGDGKGKTTAAVGLAVRAAGQGKKGVFAQFLKTGGTGEIAPLTALGVDVVRSARKLGFTFQMDDETKALCREEQRAVLARVREKLADGGVDVLVLDEALDALALGMLAEADVRALLAAKDDALEIVLTGRPVPPWLTEIADYISEVKKIKHPFDKGIRARAGIDF
jgi:cob(I)alamin adenosyltransferase